VRRRARVVAVLLLFALSSCGATTTPSGGDGDPFDEDLRLGWARPQDRVDVSLPSADPFLGTAPPRVPDVLLLNFWASWCGPCKDELPLLQRLDEQQGVSVAGITRDRYVDYARQSLDEAGVSYPNWQDFDATYLSDFTGIVPPQGVPSSVLVVDGRVEAVHVGPLETWDDLAPILRSRETA
jgi:thiol-disulfide isomerase/thioredoxin